MLQDFFNGKELNKSINPDEAVAYGAAVQAAILSGDKSEKVQEMLLVDVAPLSLGIETAGGVMTKLIEKNTTIPTRKQQIFTTAEDNQNTVTVHVLRGERERVSDNKSLQSFNLSGIRPAPRAVPQIEVTFDMDASGILHVSAKDKGSGKEERISIQASSGLSEGDIKRMVEDAETHAKEDQVLRELVEARNHADTLCHTVRRSLQDAGEKADSALQEEAKAALREVEEKMQGDDKEALAESCRKLAEIAQKLMQASSSEAAREAQEAQETKSPGADDASASSERRATDGGGNGARVQDADFDEIADDDGKEDREDKRE